MWFDIDQLNLIHKIPAAYTQFLSRLHFSNIIIINLFI